ncbi:MAG: heavy metal translocating P-type ATPase [Pseudomonadota bacterium]
MNRNNAAANGDLDTDEIGSLNALERESERMPGRLVRPPGWPDDGHARSVDADSHGRGGWFGRHGELIFSLLSGAALLIGWMIERSSADNGLPAFIAAYGFGGYFTLREAIENIAARRFKIDTLMLVAAAGAAALGSWAEGALLLFLFSLGHALEEFAMGRARREIEALATLAPDRANVRSGSAIKHVPVETLNIGDIIVVKPNERLPVDGVVIAGETSVNQAPVTGESAPVDKRPFAGTFGALDFAKIAAEHRVFAGTINGAGAIDVHVAKRAGESTLARVARMVAEAQMQRSPTENFTERFERFFVPAVLTLVVLLLFAWVVIDEPFSASFYRAMAVLVAASPCALAISVPSAVLSGIARAGRGGVLVKGGAALENLGTLSVVGFDKTGTLTEGKPRLVDIVPASGVAEVELLAVAVAIEEQSDHPLAAAAVVRDAMPKLQSSQRLMAESVEGITGKGVTGRIEGAVVHIGKPAMFDGEDGLLMSDDVRETARRLEQEGRTVMIVQRGNRSLGALGFLDVERGFAAAVIADLRTLGIARMIMLTGDNQKVADAIAMKVGLDDARGALMPEDKVAFIRRLRTEEGAIAMIGDGVNDAPALAEATVGVAMGAAGSDVALETADVALMADDLRHLPFALGLSRQTSAIIKQNLWASLGVVALLIPATLFGLNIGAAIIVHEGSTLLVVANALRLLAYKGRMAPVYT